MLPVSLIYGVSATMAGYIAYYFYTTKDGMIRKLLIAFFSCLCWYQGSWCVYTVTKTVIVANSIYWLFAVVPFVGSLLAFTAYILYNKYK